MDIARIRKAVAAFMVALVTLPATVALVEGSSPFTWQSLAGAVASAAASAYAVWRVPNEG